MDLDFSEYAAETKGHNVSPLLHHTVIVSRSLVTSFSKGNSSWHVHSLFRGRTADCLCAPKTQGEFEDLPSPLPQIHADVPDQRSCLYFCRVFWKVGSSGHTHTYLSLCYHPSGLPLSTPHIQDKRMRVICHCLGIQEVSTI